jgi:hypothetical protein
MMSKKKRTRGSRRVASRAPAAAPAAPAAIPTAAAAVVAAAVSVVVRRVEVMVAQTTFGPSSRALRCVRSFVVVVVAVRAEALYVSNR